MAIIYSYPIATPELTDLVVGTHINTEGNFTANPTKSFLMQDIVTLVSDNLVNGGWNGTFQVSGTAIPGSGSGVYRLTIVDGIITTVALVG